MKHWITNILALVPPSMRALALVMLLAAPSAAQLTEGMTLVVYDSRIADSRSVAEFYAGSLKVPGGVGNLPGTRPGVRVVDLAPLATATTPGNISHNDFVTRLRDPLRAYLASSGLTHTIRCIALTKGLPHRIQDTDNAAIGDNPAAFIDEFNANDVTCASVDSELCLLWTDLRSGEAGGSADSKADGLIVNPYWKSSRPINDFSTANITATKSYLQIDASGPVWQGLTTGTGTQRVTPGDIYLVVRLDAKTLADTQAMLTRAKALAVNPTQVALLFDEDSVNDLDNAGGLTGTNAGNDYTQSTTLLQSDGRFPQAGTQLDPTAGVSWNTGSNVNNFFVGPNLAFASGHGIVISTPVLLLATYGSNHSGVPNLSGGTSSRTTYASSFNFAPGCIFNTIESYNGRDFGGLGGNPSVPQQQASDFLAAGGTFALANVWEPLAETIPDNLYLTQNFLIGNLTYAEAAYSSLPALSWMQIVVGDPLARMVRTSEDADGTMMLSIDDLQLWTRTPSDLNRSGVADAADRELLLRMLRVSERAEMLWNRP